MDRQKEILRTFDNDKSLILTKAEIIKKGNIGYFINTSKHVGDTLTRMVKNRLLIRVKKGHYKLGSHVKTKRAADIVDDENQTKLF